MPVGNEEMRAINHRPGADQPSSLMSLMPWTSSVSSLIRTAGTPDTHAVTSTDTIPLWAKYSSRDEGSLIVGTGRYSSVSIAKKKWHDSSAVQTFDEFANTIAQENIFDFYIGYLQALALLHNSFASSK